ncbi:MAG: hypothetical protein BMS9Abin04_482 [Planctomycetia bacterium]|nr:MAG: hypothetical protein BMS9Abin04_482 [Planctomycetia bacterium]
MKIRCVSSVESENSLLLTEGRVGSGCHDVILISKKTLPTTCPQCAVQAALFWGHPCRLLTVVDIESTRAT